MSRDPRHHLGQLGERLAAEYLVGHGFQILERNYRTRWGELDIVAFDGSTLAFCEIKTRRLRRPGPSALDAVGARKRARVRRIAGSWLRERRSRPYARLIRFDAIGITFDSTGRLLSLEHVQGAF